MKLASAAQMKELDRQAIEERGIPSIELMERAALSSEVVKILIKALGVCCLCELAGQVCREAGQLAIASKIDLAGKVTILLLALPLFRELLELSLSLMDR